MDQATNRIVIFILYCYTIHGYNVTLKNLFIAVKTTKNNEVSRLPPILDTWFMFAKEQIWFFTDYSDSYRFWRYQKFTNGHIIVTNCGSTHSNADLCCKTNFELNISLSANTRLKWICLFDDDNYVNVPKLVKKLRSYSYRESWYLGRRFHEGNRPSIIEIPHIWSKTIIFYGTLGAGVCFSRTLLEKIQSYFRHKKTNLMALCEKIKEPDDVTLGHLIGNILGVKLTHVPTFHSHLEHLERIPASQLKEQISLGYTLNEKDGRRVNIAKFCKKKDRTRFYSIHCFLGYCKNGSRFNNLLESKKIKVW